MSLELQWRVSLSTTAFHACQVKLEGEPLADPKLEEALEEPCRQLADFLTKHDLDAGRTFEHLIPLSAQIDGNGPLAATLLVKILGKDNFSAATQSELTAIFTALERATSQAIPEGLEQLVLRGNPLKQQWEARGPGLGNELARLTSPELLAPRAEVILVFPIQGGGGAAHLPYNSVHMEAVLANPHRELPEELRLGWLLSQLQLDLPKYSDSISFQQRALLARLAMLPPILAAAEEVELARCDEATLLLALKAWRVGTPAPSERVAATLLTWWRTMRSTATSWTIALPALQGMLATETTAN